MRTATKFWYQFRKRELESRMNSTCSGQKNLKGLKQVAIDGVGECHYMMAKVYVHGQTRLGKDIIRASHKKRHADIYKTIQKESKQMNLCSMAQGGGFLIYDKELRLITLAGASRTFGAADHSAAKLILECALPGFKILVIK